MLFSTTLEKGKMHFIEGEKRSVWDLMHKLSVEFFHKKQKTLIIDTTNSLNPHHSAYKGAFQKQYFRNIYCVRTPLPYDLWARLGTTGSFLQKNKINVLIVTSLSLIFKDFNAREIQPITENILQRIDYLTRKSNLITIIGNSSSTNKSAMIASAILSDKKGDNS